MDALGFLKFVLDPQRLAVAGLIAARPRTPAQLASETGGGEREILRAVAPLLQAGIVTRSGATYALDGAALRALARDLPAPEPAAAELFFGMTEAEGAVLARHFRDRRLVEMPAARSKRLVVLQRLAQEFDPGVRYPERDVNRVLERFHPDYATLRRYLVDEGFLDRAGGEYWRSGGRVPLGDGLPTDRGG